MEYLHKVYMLMKISSTNFSIEAKKYKCVMMEIPIKLKRHHLKKHEPKNSHSVMSKQQRYSRHKYLHI